MATKLEERIYSKGWKLFDPSIKGVTVFVMETNYDWGSKHKKLKNIGLLKDNHWFNYVFFAGDEPHLNEHIDYFLIDCEMKDNWKRHVKE